MNQDRRTSLSSRAEEIRLRYLYRDLVLRGRLRLPLEAAKKLVGPDCAYHLYSRRTPFPGRTSGRK